MCIRGVALDFEGVRAGRKVRAPKALQGRGVSMGMLSKKSFKFVHFFVFHPTITFLAVLLSDQGREPSTNSTPTHVVDAEI